MHLTTRVSDEHAALPHQDGCPVRRASPQVVGKPDERIAPAAAENPFPNCHSQMPSFTSAIIDFNAFNPP
jgi:hypothetical protein